MEWGERLNTVFEYIEKNLYEIDYEEISRIVLCPTNILQRFFALNIGVTLTEYIRSRRLSESALELQYTDRKVIDIALNCGYETSDTFGVAFKRFHGITPSEARQYGAKIKTYPSFLFDIKIKQKKGETPMERILELTANIEREPKNIMHILNRMEAYIELREYRKATDDLKRAEELAPDRPYWQICAYFREGIFDEEIKDLAKADTKQADAFYHHFKGCVYQVRCRFIESVEEVTKAIELNPSNAWYYHSRAECYAVLQKYDEWFQDSTKSIELNPLEGEFRGMMGAYYLNTGKNLEAIQEYIKCLELKPADTMDNKWHMNRACMNLGSYDEGIKAYTKILEKHPLESALYFCRGWFYSQSGKGDEALQDLKRAVELNPSNIDALCEIGWVAFHVGDYAAVIQNQTELIKLEPNHEGHWYWRGRAYLRNHQYAEAIQDLTKAIELKPSNWYQVFNYLNRGVAYYFADKFDESIQDQTKVIELVKALKYGINAAVEEVLIAGTFLWRGKSYYKLGKLEEAVKDFTEALEFNKSNTRLYELRGEIYRILGQKEKALADLEKCTELKDNSDIFWNTWQR